MSPVKHAIVVPGEASETDDEDEDDHRKKPGSSVHRNKSQPMSGKSRRQDFDQTTQKSPKYNRSVITWATIINVRAGMLTPTPICPQL